MRTTLSSYALVGLEAVPVNVPLVGDRIRLVEPETARCLRWVKLRTTVPGGPTPLQVVNTHTLAPGRSAPAGLKKDAEREACEFGQRLGIARVEPVTGGPDEARSRA